MQADELHTQLNQLLVSTRDAVPLREMAAVSAPLIGPAIPSASQGSQQTTDFLSQLGQLNEATKSQLDTLRENTQALVENTRTKGQSGASTPGTAASVAQTATSFLSGGLGLIPLIGGLFSLFGGGKENTPAPLPKFELPPPIKSEAGLSTDGSLYAVDRTLGGRVVPVPLNNQPSNSTIANTNAAQSSTNVTVQIQAMDSQSFLDRSNDIAQAVRSAMLHSSTLNDVVADL